MSTIELIKGSCVDQNTDAIVNAANKYLLAGSGLCGEIFKRAGLRELTEACSQIQTPLNDGAAVITEAININNTKYIIHAVGPDFGLKPKAFNELYQAYYNSLNLLKANNLHSISFPLISSGIYGGLLDKPALESAKQCLLAYNTFTKENEDYDIHVILCAYTDNEYKEVFKLIKK